MYNLDSAKLIKHIWHSYAPMLYCYAEKQKHGLTKAEAHNFSMHAQINSECFHFNVKALK